MSWADALRWVLDGGSAVIAWWVIRNVAWFGTLSEFKRWACAFAIPVLLSTLVFCLGVWFNYFELPAGAQGWVETLFPHWFVAVVAAKTVHEGFKAKGK